jgi:purine-cytosine permease-like protein
MTLFTKEPVLTIGGIVAAIVALLAIFGVVVETKLVETFVVVAIPLIGAIVARFHVTPVTAKKPSVKVTKKSGNFR